MIKKVNLKMRLFSIPVIILCLGIVLAVPASAIQPIPHAFYGNIQINGEPAPIGTRVEVRGEGIMVGVQGNPIVTTEVGKYASDDPFGVKLIAQGDIEGNPVLSFYINGQPTEQTYLWQSGEITCLDLTLTVSSTTPPSSEPPTQPSILQGVLFGEDYNVSISNTGEILETIEVSADLPEGIVQINIEAGAVALSQDGSPLTNLTSEVDATPPPAPEGFGGILLPCNFGPSGATFDPSIKLIFHYDSNDIPENTNEEDLVIAYYDNSSGKWVTLPSSEVDTVNNTVTALVSHFTSFAILVPQVEILPPATIPPSTPAAPSPAESPTPAPSPPAPSSPAPAPEETTELAPEEAPLSPPTPSEQPGANTNWPVLGGIIAAGALIIIIVIARRIRQRD